jgi:isopropylmalate/homocitrate/citramalate synthase
VGHKRRFVMGKTRGLTHHQQRIDEMGFRVDDENSPNIQQNLKHLVIWENVYTDVDLQA